MAKEKITESSGNVFADLGFQDAEELDLKAELAFRLLDVMKKRQLKQTAAAELTGISQPDLSRVLRGHLQEMSAERLFRALRRLDAEIDISFKYEGEVLGAPIHLEPMVAA